MRTARTLWAASALTTAIGVLGRYDALLIRRSDAADGRRSRGRGDPTAAGYEEAKNGWTLVDRELYLPSSWTEDRDRCREADVPEEVGFATKPQLGIAMLARAHAAGVLTGWVTADEAYGQHRAFRDWLATHEVPFVLATRSDDTLPVSGRRRRLARSLATEVPASAWERRSAWGRRARPAVLRLGHRRPRPRRTARSVEALAAHQPPDQHRRQPTRAGLRRVSHHAGGRTRARGRGPLGDTPVSTSSRRR
jgi:hypothetical protein